MRRSGSSGPPVPARFAALRVPFGGALARENPNYAARIVGSLAVLPFGCISVRDEKPAVLGRELPVTKTLTHRSGLLPHFIQQKE
jgi:hypothetical protein